MFEKLTWLPDRALIDDLVFRLEQSSGADWELGDQCFRLYKNRQLVEQFDRFWSSTDFRPRRVLEIGIWDGGSTALWFEHLKPERMVAIDLANQQDSEYFRQYVRGRGLQTRLFTRWQTNQADRAVLHELVERDLGGELDLVVDDGSHLAAPTRASFEALFPLLPAGGLYIIEDWAWEHWPEFQDPNHFWAGEEGLGSLVCDLVAATGSSKTFIKNVAVYEGFVVVERGEVPDDPGEFRLANHIRRRPRRQPFRAAAAAAPSAVTSSWPEEDVKLFAFYLPQFHPIPENDRWWGKGFTEWTRVSRARPQFNSHYQPHLPERLGFYDLRLPEVRERQAALAREYGVHGFCYYYYWFGTKTLLERPLLEMLESGVPDFPFCLCWANENWTRRWDGGERDLLIEQHYGPELDAALIDDVTPFFRDPRYLRIGGLPVMLVYRPDAIPEPLATTARWRRAAIRNGLPGLHLVGAQTFGLSDPRPMGFDAAVEFPPHNMTMAGKLATMEGVDPDFRGDIVDFTAIARERLSSPAPAYRVYRTAMAGWDNTARRGRQATIFHNASPEAYEKWLRELVAMARLGHPDHRLVFINAWNEWAEGAHLEPDTRFGTGYLEATRRALE
ncbi:MAG TPA: glycoside hydrolase family 99-like domain-containing protein [Blastocatellia bacterium]